MPTRARRQPQQPDPVEVYQPMQVLRCSARGGPNRTGEHSHLRDGAHHGEAVALVLGGGGRRALHGSLLPTHLRALGRLRRRKGGSRLAGILVRERLRGQARLQLGALGVLEAAVPSGSVHEEK